MGGEPWRPPLVRGLWRTWQKTSSGHPGKPHALISHADLPLILSTRKHAKPLNLRGFSGCPNDEAMLELRARRSTGPCWASHRPEDDDERGLQMIRSIRAKALSTRA